MYNMCNARPRRVFLSFKSLGNALGLGEGLCGCGARVLGEACAGEMCIAQVQMSAFEASARDTIITTGAWWQLVEGTQGGQQAATEGCRRGW
jgi:hypothetical protein